MSKTLASNLFLTLGVVILVWFGAMELLDLQVDPLIPATSAFFIGCTAVLDRIGLHKELK